MVAKQDCTTEYKYTKFKLDGDCGDTAMVRCFPAIIWTNVELTKKSMKQQTGNLPSQEKEKSMVRWPTCLLAISWTGRVVKHEACCIKIGGNEHELPIFL